MIEEKATSPDGNSAKCNPLTRMLMIGDKQRTEGCQEDETCRPEQKGRPGSSGDGTERPLFPRQSGECKLVVPLSRLTAPDPERDLYKYAMIMRANGARNGSLEGSPTNSRNSPMSPGGRRWKLVRNAVKAVALFQTTFVQHLQSDVRDAIRNLSVGRCVQGDRVLCLRLYAGKECLLLL